MYGTKFSRRILISVPVVVPNLPNRINVLKPFGLSDEDAPEAAWVDIGHDNVGVWITDHTEVWNGWGPGVGAN
jgi:hypothetical protein